MRVYSERCLEFILQQTLFRSKMIRFSMFVFVVLGCVVLPTASAEITGELGGECFADCDCYGEANTTACYTLPDDTGICWCKPGMVYNNDTMMCVVDCCTLPLVQNGYYMLDTDETKVGATATLDCCDGYTTSNDVSITCTEEGWWSDAAESCVKEPTCPSSDWLMHGTSCYLFGTTRLTYNAARAFCGGFNGNLVQVDTIAELIFLKETMNTRNPQPRFGFWNDLFEVTLNGEERWRTSNDPLLGSVSDWNRRQPDDFNGVQACTAFWRSFQYRQADIECTNDVTAGQDNRLCNALCEINL